MRRPRTAMKSGPRLPQLEKALAQKRRPNTAKNKLINQLKKKKGVSQISLPEYIQEKRIRPFWPTKEAVNANQHYKEVSL